MRDYIDKRLGEGLSRWRNLYEQGPKRHDVIIDSTMSGISIDPLYLPQGDEISRYVNQIGYPGEYPFTRGIHATGYRGKLWTIRQFSGFGTAKQTNERYKYLLANGQTGLSVAFDMPTLMGYDSDHPLSQGEVGKCGVAIDSILDMEELFEGIDLGSVTTSMTINSPAAVLLAMYLVVAKKKGIPWTKIGGTLQNDILKEFIAQKEYVFPPVPSVRLVVDTVEFCTKYVPQWNTISVSGYHIREAGSTAVQELAFTIADGITYVQACIERGLDVDDFAPRISFFFNAHIDFFEEIAKFRAARRMWAKIMRERFGAKNPRSWLMRFHTQTAGVSLTAQQPEVNIVRTAIEALAAVLGGTQSLHTNAMDEVLALPTEKAARIALRTQQVIAYETGVANTIDPLGGSYFVEALTDKVEMDAWKYIDEIESLGGVIPALERGYFQNEIADAAFRFQRELEEKKRIFVGVNAFCEAEDEEIPILRIPEEVEKEQIQRVKKLKGERDNDEVNRCLRRLADAARGNDNLMPYIIEAVEAYATEGEIMETLANVFGRYVEKTVY
jgi:methylmalonyl-CoA mutase N-terminal domain/subunit